jgi:glycogenin glucosyltransferase
MWEAMQEDMRIVHYTLTKPFESETTCPNNEGSCDPERVLDLKRHRKFLAAAKKKWEGHFEKELSWWEVSFEEMMEEIGRLCPAA